MVKRLLCLITLLLMPVGSLATDLRIAAASDLRPALDRILETFRAQHPDQRIDVIYGSSGRMHTQIRFGAPYHLFFSADRRYPERLAADGHTAGPVTPYAVGRLVLWHPGNTVTADTFEQLAGASGPRRLAIANPRHAPYGERAMEALKHRQLDQPLASRLVNADNVAQVAHLVGRGHAELGLMALSIARTPGLGGHYWLIPQSWHAPLEQALVITHYGRDTPLAHALAATFADPDTQAILAQFGFEPAPESAYAAQ